MRKKLFSTLGIVFLLLGIVLAAIGIANFFCSIADMERPRLFFLCFIGFPLFAIGAALLAFANAGTLHNRAMHHAAKMSAIMNGQKTVCPSCNTIVENGDFCSACGTKLKQDP